CAKELTVTRSFDYW
nr:immunoglobulin heavy chain junction region [Macaca mulatta]